MGVRVDREGLLCHDFQKAEPLDAQGKISGKVTIGSRHYLSDAAFLVALEGPDDALEAIQNALKRPFYMLFLGRKAFHPLALSGEQMACATNAACWKRCKLSRPWLPAHQSAGG